MIKKILTHWSIAFVTLFVLTFIGLQDPQVKEILRLKGFDLLLQSEKKEVSQDIGVITIDEKAIEKYGQWPWKRDVLADVINQLRESEVGIIVLPILFAEEDRLGGDVALAEAIQGNSVVIAQIGTNQTNKNSVPRGIAKIGEPLPFLFEWEGMLGPIPILGQNADGVGVVNTAPEIDGVTRRIPLIMKIGNETYPAMAIEVIRVATQAPSYQIKSGPSGIIAMRVPGFNTIETDANARIWLRWNKEYETISLADTNNFKQFKGRTVIIASTAEGLNSIIATPTGEKYSYELTASTLQTVLDGKQINRYDYSLFLELIISIVVGLLIVILTRFTPYWFVGIKMIAMYGASIYISYYLFHKYSILADASWIIITLTIVGFHSVFNRFVLEFQLKQQIKKQFEHYLEPKMVKKITRKS
jgi:adenylate cyclase